MITEMVKKISIAYRDGEDCTVSSAYQIFELKDKLDKQGFEYANEKCVELYRKIKELIDGAAVHADWLNNNNLKKTIAKELMMLLCHNGYPPQWSQEICDKGLDQIESFRANN